MAILNLPTSGGRLSCYIKSKQAKLALSVCTIRYKLASFLYFVVIIVIWEFELKYKCVLLHQDSEGGLFGFEIEPHR